MKFRSAAAVWDGCAGTAGLWQCGDVRIHRAENRAIARPSPRRRYY